MAMALAALTAATAGLAQGSPNLRSMIFVTGSCERLTTPGRDRSASCRSTVVNLTYRGGRTSFAFTEADTAMVSFSGTREIRAGDRVTLILDMISVASNPGPTLDSAAATGSCDYSNPYAGRSYIRCSGRTAAGEFGAAFTSNGEPPTVQQMPQAPEADPKPSR